MSDIKLTAKCPLCASEVPVSCHANTETMLSGRKQLTYETPSFINCSGCERTLNLRTIIVPRFVAVISVDPLDDSEVPMNPIECGRDMVDQVPGIENATLVMLASYSEADYPNVLAADHATCSFAEYEQRLAGAIAHLEQRGLQVVTVPVTADELTRTMREHNLSRAPDGRAAAIGIIHHSRQDPT